MTDHSTTSGREALVRRLDAALTELTALAQAPATDRLTEADKATGEQWRLGQAWAHVAEFPGYWTAEMCGVLAAPADSVPSFGRTLDDERRLEAVLVENARTGTEVLPRLTGDVGTLRTLLGLLPDEAWDRRGVHAVHGVMTVEEIVDEFLVGHLEEHVEQIASLYR
ncbi:DinB family protein [Kitasatospora sp. GP82]|uniref:DinB family protein n=1 Tax=Kitasatospora sp. GP82 TaxID=3035089 RepID=UPI0024749057|nr:DinB family protein [Kitasatospora sp. GP82]MDH6124061.1 hypothetical protein [Kitasatospora sp. GP82]